MSSIIWTRSGQKSNLRKLVQDAWRVVEDQSQTATRKLVDSDQEQERLEELIESVKPHIPAGPEWDHLHYLLFTPFRYPPLAHGSRFGRRSERGLWYGSAKVETALAETAFWRLQFLNATAADIRSELVLTAFCVSLSSRLAVDLTAAPLAAYESKMSSKTSYEWSQPLGGAMRADGVQFCRYVSARDPERGTNAAVFSPAAFVRKTVSDRSRENWHSYATKTEIEFRRQGFAGSCRLRFARQIFEVNGRLPVMESP